jgi:flagellar biosynthesis protein FlhF
MKMHRFSGTTSREVLAKVKQALGEDAIIISNRAHNGVLEIMAAAGDELDLQTPAPAPVAVVPLTAVPPTPTCAPAELDELRDEIQRVKLALQRDIAALATANSRRAAGRDALLGTLLNAGFSPQLAKRLAEATNSGHDAAADASAVAERLQQSLMLAESDEIVTRGGVYALVGPTGAGKTTTVAKIAARAVVRFGASNVALLTTDSYRIGAHEQLRIYGRILDVPVHIVRDQSDLSETLAELRGRHLVLIDTIGMSQRDAMVAQHAAMLAGSGDVKRLLLLQATSSARTLEEVVTAYESTGVHGCILTKTDEAAGLAGALDVIVRHALPLHYVTDGQRVPEDMRLPDRADLVREAVEAAVADALSVAPEDFPLLTTAMTARASTGVAIG